MSFPEMTSTLCLVEINRSGTARVCNAGHMPPVIAVGLEARLIEDHGVLLGVHQATDTPVVTAAFPPGALIVLTTDGLVERREEEITAGLERLRTSVLNHRGPIQTLSDQLLIDVSSRNNSFDDIAIVAARHKPR
jgi:serine phosphatase RsbU (regulator of sigma subunit)